MPETVYILTNEAMPEFIKIGRTSGSVENRMKQLDKTNVPLPFECYYASRVEDSPKEEAWLHSVFADRRSRDKREFFRVDPERVVKALKRIELEDITPKNLTTTPQQQQQIEKGRTIRSRFNFSQYGIPKGSIIQFSRDNSIQATVTENNKIIVDGVITSLSLAAQKILGYNYGVAGTLYWMYDGETLDERRRRLDIDTNNQAN